MFFSSRRAKFKVKDLSEVQVYKFWRQAIFALLILKLTKVQSSSPKPLLLLFSAKWEKQAKKGSLEKPRIHFIVCVSIALPWIFMCVSLPPF